MFHPAKNEIDFDFARISDEYSFGSRTEILRMLEELEGQVNGQSYEEVYLKRKIHASIYYLYACLGERISFNEYILNVLGITPVYFEDKMINSL